MGLSLVGEFCMLPPQLQQNQRDSGWRACVVAMRGLDSMEGGGVSLHGVGSAEPLWRLLASHGQDAGILHQVGAAHIGGVGHARDEGRGPEVRTEAREAGA